MYYILHTWEYKNVTIFFSKCKLYQIAMSPFYQDMISVFNSLNFISFPYSISGNAKILGSLQRPEDLGNSFETWDNK